MQSMVNDTISFLSTTYPKLYSYFYLDHLKEYAPNYNVNKTQLRALIFIKTNGAKSMTDLCMKLNIEKGSLTSMIDDLTNKGYVVRERDLNDRRKYLINLTEEGDKIASDFMDKLSVKLDNIITKMDEKDREDYLDAINKLKKILNKVNIK